MENDETEPETQTPEETEAPVNLFQLPEFEGTLPVGVITKIRGTGQRITRSLGIGESIVLVVEAVVTGVDHKNTKDGIKRVHSLDVSDLFEVEGREARQLISKVRVAHKKEEDKRAGRKALPGLEEEPKTDHGLTLDENGVALTAEEVAELKGETPPEADIDPVVFHFEDGGRAAWPDDFEYPELYVDTVAGESVIRPSDNNEHQVIKIVDLSDGSTIDEWNEERESERLLALEYERLASENLPF